MRPYGFDYVRGYISRDRVYTIYIVYRRAKIVYAILRFARSDSSSIIAIAILTGATYNEASDSKNKIPEAI